MRFVRHPNSSARIIGGHAFVVTKDENRMHTLGSTATRLWSIAEQPVSTAAAAHMLTEATRIDPDTALDDINDCVEDLVKRQILRVVA